MSDQPLAFVSVDIEASGPSPSSFFHDRLVGLPAIAAYVEEVEGTDDPVPNG